MTTTNLNIAGKTLKAVWLEFPARNRAFGGGGWSRRAKRRPAPERRELITSDVIFTTGQSVIVAGQRKLKLNLFVAATGEVVRADYPIEGLTEFGLNTRQISARRRVAAAREKKLEVQMAEAAQARLAARAEVIAAQPQDVAGWFAAGCVHPAPAAVQQAKDASGLSWSQFERNGGAL